MSTLLYNPGIRIALDTRSHGIIDVTEDIESGSLTLNENTFHTLNFTLSSRGGKYVGILTPNDRVVVQMKRVTWLQTFTGYLNTVPYFSTFNQSVNLSATCTMKRILYHYWDPGLPAAVELLFNSLNSPTGGQATTPDAGMTQVIQSLLTKVVGWDPAQIHVGVIPSDFLKSIAGIWSEVETSITNSVNNLGGVMVGGTFGTSVGSYAAPNLNGVAAPPGTTIPMTSGLAQVYDANSKWDASLHWGYMAPGTTASPQSTAKNYLKGPDSQGQRLLVANAITGKTICVATTDYMDSSQPQGAINLSADAMTALGISGGEGEVAIAWAPVTPTTPFGPFAVPTATGATSTTGASQSGLATGPAGQLAQGNWEPATPNPLSSELDGLRSLMNDTSILPTIQAVVNTGLRQFCAAPNGDFIAWFPDYFGVYGTAAVWNLETIEMQDFTIAWSDANLITHEFAVGSTAGAVDTGEDPSSEGQSIQGYNMLTSYGVATIDVPGLFQALFGTGPGDNGLFGVDAAQQIYQQFGARPNFDQMPTVAQGEIEFWYALHNWMLSWSQQFSCNLPLTFMPELFPGMLLRIAAYGFQAYIHSVTHSWSLQDGAGFSTSVNIMAPSSTDGNGLIGLARSG
jgi:hypothetical protein